MMHAFITWLNMGGYAAYVWSAYAVVFMVFVGNLLELKQSERRTWRKLKRWIKTS